MLDPNTLKFTKTHEWLSMDNALVTVGISNHAQDLLGDIVFVELPDVNKKVSLNEPIAVVESVKAASDIYAPLNGEIESVNQELVNDPTLINNSCYGDGWLFKIRLDNLDQSNEHLIDHATYQNEYVE